MLTILAFTVGAVMLLVLVLLAVVVVGIRQEPPTDELTTQAPSLIAALVRRVLGVYVRKPDPPSVPDEQTKTVPYGTRRARR
jgi:hypothetical protein